MKLQPDQAHGPSITGYGPGWVAINGQSVPHSVLLSSMGHQEAWACADFASLGPAHFGRIADWGAELVLFGSGERLRFPQPAWLAELYARRIGVETMDTQAACRTYNFLAAEGRKVVAALLV
ncbi:MAG: hypothetical protein EBT37_06290 [Betaproteobacteria bacterium]|nr:hypothetical protein [Betaproteobacteria bacterium]